MLARLKVWVLLGVVGLSVPVWAQGSKKPMPPGNTKVLDTEAAKVEESYLKGLSDLAKQYEEAGDRNKAKAMLEAILKIRPDIEPVQHKIRELDEAVFKDQQEQLDVDVSKGWITSGILVEKGRKLRIEAIGTYKFTLVGDVTPEGLQSQADQQLDFFEGAPTGALIGMIIPPGTKPGRSKDGPQPFMIGNRKELEPQQSGLLVLRVNTPPSAKSLGRLKVQFSGNFAKLGG